MRLVGDIIQCTIVNNSASHSGGGVEKSSNGTVVNSIVRGNDAPQGANVELGAGVVVSYSNVEGHAGGIGNIDADALLSSDYRPGLGSPCLDAGDDGAANLPSTDIDGDDRIGDGDGGRAAPR